MLLGRYALVVGSVQDPEGAQGQSKISVVIADDHTVVRQGLKMLLEAGGARVVAEAGDAETAKRYVLGHKPAVLVLDLNMPGRPSLDVVPEIRQASPRTGIVVLTMQDDPAFARHALQAGVCGYVLKEAADTELIQAVRSAATGKTYLQPSLGARLASEPKAPVDALSDREREVLRLIALGHTNAEIAAQLFLSVRTVETHRARIQRKLGVSSRAELVHIALGSGLLDD
jgi:two-component system response regulator NreC